jgi:hypothetical protein
MPSLFEIFILAAVYITALATLAVMKWRELRRDNEKKARYWSMPWWYRALCPMLVVPLFTVVPLVLFGLGHEIFSGIVLFAAAPVAMLFVEIGAVRWYRKAGLWSVE